MATSADLEVIKDPSLPLEQRRSAIRRSRQVFDPVARDALLDVLVHALNEKPAPLQAEIADTLRHLDAWLLVGVRHGLLVRARVAPGDVQLDEALACFDAELGHVVDLHRLDELILDLADPPPWLLAMARPRR